MSQVTGLTVPGAERGQLQRRTSVRLRLPIATVPTKGTAPCWVTITPNRKYTSGLRADTAAAPQQGGFTSEYRLSPSGG